METITLFKNLYTQAFFKLKTYQVSFLKVLSWFVLVAIITGVYAFIYRVATGYFVI